MKKIFSCIKECIILCFITNLFIQGQPYIYNTVVAEIDTLHLVTFDDVQAYVNEYHFPYLYRPIGKGYFAALDQIITKRLKVIDFFRKELDKKSKSLKNIRRIIAEELVNEYYKTQYYDKYINDSTIRKAYEEFGKVILYQQIILKKEENISQQSLDSLRSFADSIRKMAESGIEFETLVKKYSQEINTTKNIGTVLSMNWEQSYFDNVKFAIFNIPKNTIYIIEDEQNLYIVKVIDIQYVEKEPYDFVKEKIKKTLELQYVPKAMAEFQLELQKLVDEKTIQWDTKGLEQIVKWSSFPKFYEQAYKDTIQRAIASGRNFLIAQLPKQKIDLKKYLYLLNDVLMIRKQTNITEYDIKEYIREAVSMDIVLQKALAMRLDKKILGPFTDNYVLVDEITKLYDQEVIEKQIPPKTEKALKLFYESNKDSLYYQLAEVIIYIALAPDTSTITEFKKRLDAGIPFEKVDRRVLVRKIIRDRDGTLRPEKSDVSIELAKAAFTLQLNEVAGPIEYYDSENGKKYALIKCIKIKEEKQLTYDDVKDRLVNDYKNFHREKIKEKVRNQLMKQFNVKIYTDRLKDCLVAMKIPTQ